jgi:hypothetical protein
MRCAYWKPDLIPRWLLPVAAGGAMLAAAISSEYGWYGRVAGQLPETFVVAQTYDERAALRPWTFLVSYTSRFVAVDRGSTRTNPQLPDQRMVDLYFFGRWAPVQKLTGSLGLRGPPHGGARRRRGLRRDGRGRQRRLAADPAGRPGPHGRLRGGMTCTA